MICRADDFSQLTEENDRSFGIATGTLSGWVSAAKPTYTMVNSSAAALVTVKGSYAGQATGEFRLLFSANAAPGFDNAHLIEPLWEGAVYRHHGHEAWLCPALFYYFTEPPKVIYFRAELIEED